MSCYLSSGCFQSADLAQVLSLCLEYGLDLELSSGFSVARLEGLELVRGRVSFLVHNYFPPPEIPFVLNLASDRPKVRDNSLALCRMAIKLCARLGAPFYSVHAGFCMHLEPSDLGDPKRQGELARVVSSREEAYQRFLDAVATLSRYAAKHGVALLVENNVVAQENLAPDGSYPLLLAGLPELRRFCSDIAEHSVGILLDTGHAKVSAATLGSKPEAYLEELAPFIGCLHLSDNDGRRDTNLPITDESWFAPFLPRFAALPMVVEVYKIPLEQMLTQQRIVSKLTGQQHELAE